MTTAMTKVPIGDPSVFHAGSQGRRRAALAGTGAGLLALAYVAWLATATASPRVREVGIGIEMAVAVLGLLLLAWAFWRRSQAYEIRREGIRLLSGGSVFGDKQLVPWSSIARFGGRRLNDGRIRLLYRQQHVGGDCPLPGEPLDEDAYHRLIDRLHVVLDNRYARLHLGGVEG